MKRSFMPIFVCMWFVTLVAIAQPNPNLKLGNPSAAKADAADTDNYLLVKKQYVLSYNSSRGAPNWVSWTLHASDIRTVDRQNNFHADMSLPAGLQRVTPADYTGTGFDRGQTGMPSWGCSLRP